MGKVVAFWSDYNQTGKTTITYMVLRKIEQLFGNKIKILTIDISQGSKSIVKLFEMQKHGLCMEDIINLKINAEFSLNIEDLVARTNNMYFLRRRSFFRNMPFGHSELLDDFVDELKNCFDIAIFDTAAGNGDSFTNSIANKCDCLVNIFDGNSERISNITSNDKSINVINLNNPSADTNKQMDLLQRKYPSCYVLPYYKRLNNISDDVNIHYLIQYDSLFNKNVDSITRSILELIDMNIDKNSETINNKSLLMRLLAQ